MTVSLKPEEVKKILPKLIGLLETKIERREREVLQIEVLRNNFFKQVEMFESMQDGMVNMGVQK